MAVTSPGNYVVVGSAREATLVGDVTDSSTAFNFDNLSGWPATGPFEWRLGTEKIIGQARSGNQITCNVGDRGQDGTTASDWQSGTKARHVGFSRWIQLISDLLGLPNAAGDLIVATADGVLDRLAVGTTDQALVADTSLAKKMAWKSVFRKIRKNSAGSDFTRGRLNLIEGSGVTITMADDAVNDEVDVTIAAAGSGVFSGAKALRSTNQTITTATYTAVSLNAADDHDVGGWHDPSVNPSRITVPAGKTGYLLLTAHVVWSSNAVGERELRIYKNGADTGGDAVSIVAAAPEHQHYTDIILSTVAGDYFEVFVRHTKGSDLDITSAFFSVVLLGS